MATKTATKPQVQVQMPDIITFRQMLHSFNVKGKDNAVFARHYVQDMEATAKQWKKDADPILYALKDNAKVLATDENGVTWCVAFMPQNQKQYKQTPELIAAQAAFDAAKQYLEDVQSQTDFKMVRKGDAGYSYKVSKP